MSFSYVVLGTSPSVVARVGETVHWQCDWRHTARLRRRAPTMRRLCVVGPRGSATISSGFTSAPNGEMMGDAQSHSQTLSRTPRLLAHLLWRRPRRHDRAP